MGVLLLHDNAPVHTSTVGMSAAAECGYELLLHPPYLPDLTERTLECHTFFK